MNVAASNGHLEVVKWLQIHCSKGRAENANTLAAINNRLEVVQWLHLNRSEGCTTEAMYSAAARGYIDMVMWLYANRPEPRTPDATDRAMRAGHTRQSAPHIKQAKLLKQASNDKASVVEMDDKPDEDREDEVQEVEPDFCFEVGRDESY
ncbi:hypothetical protein JG688_00016072 [Phytophthora aleatoria]|uniref:Uncharacterized protein n=1 Tax=Phytophthora aleatoria TaxID=2496075 RepID=A0A8J5MCN4_9STRA|nr:hypothetical protein JG688_00016072 [Phytophthora aleatoria]